MIAISDSMMSLGYKTSMVFNTSVNTKKNNKKHCPVGVINSDGSLYKRIFSKVVKKKLGHDFPT